MDGMNTDAALAPMPSVVDLGRRLAAYERAYSAYDHGGAHHDGVTREEARTLLDDHMEGLRHLIATTPPVTLGDVAVQMAHVLTVASGLASFNLTEDQVEERADVVERLALSAVPILAAAAGLDMEVMDWAGNDVLRPQRWAALEAVSCP